MDILHAVEDNPPDFLQTFVRPHSAYCCPLHKNVALCQQFDGLGAINTLVQWSPRDYSYLQRASIWSDDSLSPLHEPFLIRNDVSDLDDVACNSVVQNLDGLGDVNTPGK